MKKKRDIKTLLLQQVGKDAPSILSKVEKMLRKGVDRRQIEKALIADLRALTRKELKLLSRHPIWIPQL